MSDKNADGVAYLLLVFVAAALAQVNHVSITTWKAMALLVVVAGLLYVFCPSEEPTP